MRRRSGDLVEVLGPDQTVYLARLSEDGRALALVGPRAAPTAPPGPAFTLYQAVLKGDRFTEVVEKGTELGVWRFVPLITRRTVVREVSPARRRRWETVGREAAEQCGRPALPEIGGVERLEALVARGNPEPGWVLDPSGIPFAVAIREWLPDLHWSLWVGPEGGFAPEEVAALTKLGLEAVSLGPLVWRAENAGLWAVAMLRGAWLARGEG